MVTLEIWQRIRHLEAMGWSTRRIARELGISRNTVQKALAATAPPEYRRTAPPSPLQAWEELLTAGVRKGWCGSRALREVRNAGYSGSRSAFYIHWAKLAEAQKPSPAACRFETDPGEQAQFDWAEYTVSLGGVATRVYLYSLLLGYSRRVHWFPSLACHQQAVFEGVEAGFQHFGGVCRFLVIDNPRVFVRSHGAEIQWNANFLRLAGHYRFAPIACTPRHPQAKGKVENPFHHLEQLFLIGSEWQQWEHFQQELGAFETGWEQRVHGTTKVPPVERFTSERAALLALPPRPFVGCAELFRGVSHDCLISYGGVLYSVPWYYATKQVLVRESQGRELAVFALSGQCLTHHRLCPSGSPPQIKPEHYEGLRHRHQAALAGLARQFRERYAAHGTAELFLQRLLAQHRHQPQRPLGQVLSLLESVPEALAVAALASAVEFNLCTPRFLEELLRRQWVGNPPAVPVATAASLRFATQLALPELEIERPLAGYDRALATGPEPVRKGTEQP